MNRCINCKHVKPIGDFIGKRNKIVKTCFLCRQSKMCPCGKQRYICKEHGGGGLCECEKPRYRCKVHKGQKRSRTPATTPEVISDSFQEFLSTKCTRGTHVYISKSELEYSYREFLNLQPREFDAVEFQHRLIETDGISLRVRHLEPVYYGVTLLL